MVKLIVVIIIIALAIGIFGLNDTKGATFTQPSGQTWSKETNRKLDVLVQIGMPKQLATALITECKSQAIDPAHCIKVGASILGAESTLGTNCTESFNCFGMEDGRTKYTSKTDGVRSWVTKYTKYWYKQKSPDGFYSNTPKRLPVTRYCM